MTPEQRKALEQVADLGTARQRKSRSLLPSPPPDRGTPTPELLAWLTVALTVGEDPVVNVTRYGRHDDARLVVTLRSKQRIVYDRQADVFSADTLVRRVMLATGAEPPMYGKADAKSIAGVLVRAADLVDEDDDRAEAREWARTFLEAANEIDGVHDMTGPAGKYAGLSALRDWEPPHNEPWQTAAQRSGVLRDTRGHRYVRVSDVAAHVRGIAGRPVPWTNLHGRLTEIGWLGPHEFQQRQPHGHGKAKLHAYVIPTGWEDA